MEKLRKGDIVARISYNKDILFEITNIIKTKKEEIYILKGITERIEADSTRDDLEKIDKRLAEVKVKKTENRIYNYIEEYVQNHIYKEKEEKNYYKRTSRIVYTGKILHLDGDKKYAEKSARYYKNLGLNAIVKNIAESRQPKIIQSLLDRYRPDILVITRT